MEHFIPSRILFDRNYLAFEITIITAPGDVQKVRNDHCEKFKFQISKEKEKQEEKEDSTGCMFKAALGGGTAIMVNNKS